MKKRIFQNILAFFAVVMASSVWSRRFKKKNNKKHPDLYENLWNRSGFDDEND